MNCGSKRGLRLDCKLSADQCESFSHADKAKSIASDCHLRIKTFPKILNSEMNLCLGCPLARFIVAHAAVLHGIAKRFL